MIFLAESTEVKEKVLETVPFHQVNSILEGELERKGDERRGLVEDVEEYDNQIISGGGKRFRVALPYIMAKGMDIDYSDREIIEAVTPIEMVHGLSLIMDDAIDEDERRRGMQTAHERLKEQGFTEDQAKAFANLDVMQLQSMAENAPGEMKFLDSDQQVEVSETLGDAITRLTRGQMLDVAGENLNEEGFEDKLAYRGENFEYERFYEDVVSGKTAPLFEAGPQILEVITGEEMDNLVNYAEDLGKAFQIRDDVIDISGGEENIEITQDADEELIGKDRYSDIREGTLTLPVNYTFELMEDESWEGMKGHVQEIVGSDNYLGSVEDFYQVHGDRREFLESVMAKENPANYELQLAGKVIEDTGAIERANEEAITYAESAVENLEESDVEGEYRELLEQMAYFAASRSK